MFYGSLFFFLFFEIIYLIFFFSSGKTNHFTNFAILLGGGDNECGEDVDYTISYLSIAFISVAIIIVLLSAVIIEIYVRYERRDLGNYFKRGERVSRNDEPIL